MTQNPYEAPQSFEVAEVTTADLPASRPIGVTILAVLYLIAGGAGMFSLLFLLAYHGQGVVPNAYQFELVIFNVLLFAGLSVGSGVGMWAGKKWGWWITVVNLVSGAIYQVCSLASVVVGYGPYDALVHLDQFVFSYGTSVVIVLLVVLYLFKRNVVAYFGLQVRRRSSLLARVLGVSVLISLAYFALDYLG